MPKLLLFAAIVAVHVASRPALAQIDMRAMASMDGACRAEIETQAVACQPAGTFMQFGNGRSLFVFSRGGVLYSFSGSRIQQRGDKGFALIVDMIRIASQTVPERALADAEGECTVQTEPGGGSFTAIACEAHSRGEKARYRFSLDHISNFERKAYR